HGAKILFVTANPEQIGDAAHIAEGFVSKPFNRAAIIRAIASACADESALNALPVQAGI
ncbi:MAG: response regulator, partial [Sphingomonas sp.]|nr:response regulator [Sphingomonas sp.]